ncbi:transcription termination/antitermination protein NusA [bacterium]|nr:transcription termination/antitermination protein NusA [bacterium]
MDYDFIQALEAIARNKGIEQDILYDALEAGLLAAGRRRFGEHAIISSQVDLDEGRVLVWLTKQVVRRVKDHITEISLKDARFLAGGEVVIGDELDIEVDTSKFGRSAAQTAKQVVMQRIREAERDTIYEEYKHREGTLINGIVQGDSAGGIVIDLGRTDGIMPYSERIPREQYRKGDRVKAYVLEVRKTNRSPQVIISRRTPHLVEQLFAQEIPEVADGTVEIAAIARDAGFRTKVAVRSNDSNVDAVGTCVGLRGYRIQSIVRELDQERVDLVLWDRDIVRFAKHAFNPVEVLRAEYDEGHDRILVIVPEEKLSVAIGKGGRNIKLASRLVGIRIDVRSPEQYEEEKSALTAQEEQEDVVADLIELPGVGETTAMNLYEAGFDGVESVAAASIEELIVAKGVGAKTAEKLIENAKALLEEEDY